MSKNHRFYSYHDLFALLVAAKGAQLIKLSFVLGSFSFFFSATNSIVPLMGLVGGFAGISALTLVLALGKLFSGSFTLFSLMQGVPTFFAGLYLGSSTLLIRIVLPLLCMTLFIAHPIGGQAWGYSLYWLLPVVISLFSRSPLFIQALGSTFTAHAVGSVIWLYTHSSTAIFWYALIPIVALERVSFALGMVLFYALYKKVMSVFSSLLQRISWSLI